MSPREAATEPPAPFPPAGLWRRFMSASYESVVLFGVVVFFGYGFSALLRFQGVPGGLRWAFQGFLFLVVGAYFVWFWSGGRRTLPMKTFGLRIVAADARPPTRLRAAARYLCWWAMTLPWIALAWRGHAAWLLLLPVPFLWGLIDRQGRTLYDLAAGTRLVVDTRPGP